MDLTFRTLPQYPMHRTSMPRQYNITLVRDLDFITTFRLVGLLSCQSSRVTFKDARTLLVYSLISLSQEGSRERRSGKRYSNIPLQTGRLRCKEREKKRDTIIHHNRRNRINFVKLQISHITSLKIQKGA